MEQKMINFEKSYFYYKKNEASYSMSDCHANTYIDFYEQNFEMIEKRSSAFNYVTGLVCFKDNDGKKYCVTHSWIEEMGQVVDVTMIANSCLAKTDSISNKQKNVVRKLIEQKFKYVPYFSLSQADFDLKVNQIFRECYFDRETAFKAIEEYLCSIVQNVATDKEFLKQVQAVLGYSFENSPEFGILI